MKHYSQKDIHISNHLISFDFHFKDTDLVNQ